VPAIIALGLLLVVQLVLDVIALMDLYKRPVAQVAFGNKWVWVAIIVLVNTIGAVLYLVIGRKDAQIVEAAPQTSVGTRAQVAADALYGDRKDS
jgi:hypothetical protein